MKHLVTLAALALAVPSLAEIPPPVVPVFASPAAVEVAAKLFPDGTYRRMLGPSFIQTMTGMTDSIGTLPLGPLLKAAGLPESDAGRLDKATLGEIMAILDPVYKERMRRTMDGMFAAMIPVFEKLEPDIRAGLASSLDRRFTPSQLTELRGFFATPTGSIYAAQQMQLFMDPEVMGRVQAAMPQVMAALPGIIEQVVKSANDLPKAKTYDDLTSAERDRLAKLLGVNPGDLRKPAKSGT